MTENTPKPDFDVKGYRERFDMARCRLAITRDSLTAWASQLDIEGAKALANLEPFFNIFPCHVRDEYVRVVSHFHMNTKRYGVMQLALRMGSRSIDLMGCSNKELRKQLQVFPECSDSDHHLNAINAYAELNRRINALSFLGVKFPAPAKGRNRLSSWLEALDEYGKACVSPLHSAFDDFLEVSEELDEAMFNFNVAAGKVRYRMLRCTYTLDDHDPLGPSDPSIKVVASIHPVTGSRRYNHLTYLKGQLRKRRVNKELGKQLGRPATSSELKVALTKERDRRPHEWVTKEVIKACYLGGKSGEIFRAQAKLASIMADWKQKRSSLQGLLP